MCAQIKKSFSLLFLRWRFTWPASFATDRRSSSAGSRSRCPCWFWLFWKKKKRKNQLFRVLVILILKSMHLKLTFPRWSFWSRRWPERAACSRPRWPPRSFCQPAWACRPARSSPDTWCSRRSARTWSRPCPLAGAAR